jgi:hypothetical protein
MYFQTVKYPKIVSKHFALGMLVQLFTQMARLKITFEVSRARYLKIAEDFRSDDGYEEPHLWMGGPEYLPFFIDGQFIEESSSGTSVYLEMIIGGLVDIYSTAELRYLSHALDEALSRYVEWQLVDELGEQWTFSSSEVMKQVRRIYWILPDGNYQLRCKFNDTMYHRVFSS